MVIVLVAVFAGINCEPKDESSSYRFELDIDSLTLKVGESRTIVGRTDAPNQETIIREGCEALVQVVPGSTVGAFTLTGGAPGRCFLSFTADEYTDSMEVIVQAPYSPDLDGGADAADGGGPTPICTVPVGKVGTYEGRDIYYAYTKIDSAPSDEACPIHTSTDWSGESSSASLPARRGTRSMGAARTRS